MSLFLKIQEDIKVHLRQKEMSVVSALRVLSAAVKQKHIDEGVPYTDEMVVSVLRKEKKKRSESAACYEKAHRQDLLDKENFEISLIEQYLPQELSQEELEERVNQVFSVVQPTQKSDMATLMARLKTELAGRADLSRVSRLVQEKLQLFLDGLGK